MWWYDLDLFEKISDRVSELLEDYDDTVNFIEVPHLSMWIRTPSKGYRTSKKNCYMLNHHRTYIRYTGDISKIQKKRGNDKYAVYSVDGIEVRSFDLDLDFETGLILPMLEKGRPVLQLAKAL